MPMDTSYIPVLLFLINSSLISGVAIGRSSCTSDYQCPSGKCITRNAFWCNVGNLFGGGSECSSRKCAECVRERDCDWDEDCRSYRCVKKQVRPNGKRCNLDFQCREYEFCSSNRVCETKSSNDNCTYQKCKKCQQDWQCSNYEVYIKKGILMNINYFQYCSSSNICEKKPSF